MKIRVQCSQNFNYSTLVFSWPLDGGGGGRFKFDRGLNWWSAFLTAKLTSANLKYFYSYAMYMYDDLR
jgi:hypothetical protein